MKFGIKMYLSVGNSNRLGAKQKSMSELFPEGIFVSCPCVCLER